MNGENELATLPVRKLIAKLAIPTVVITLVMAVYNMADIFLF